MTPERIGKYPVSGLLGKGGMGAVYSATHPDLGYELAIKVLLLARGAEDIRRARFEREVSALCKLDHPNVVKVVDAGEEQGLPWFAMRRVEGESLEDRMQRSGPLSVDQTVSLGRDLADALSAAHQAGVLHRDVKPDNVLLSTEGQVLLTDFGLAKDLEVAETMRISKTGVFLGSPGYWAPEQAAGDVSAFGPATDVYGLGATLYAALTGRPPIDATSLPEVLTATRDQKPTPLSKLRPDAPKPLTRVVETCLAKSPADRFASVAELKTALQGALHEPPDRGPTPLSLAAGVGVGLLIVGLVAVLSSGSGGTEDTIPEPPTQELVEARDPFELGRRAAAAGSYTEAHVRFLEAAQAGDGRAMTRLGIQYEQARGVEQDLAEAVSWYRKGAQAGHGWAMVHLALMLERGRGVEKDLEQAVGWYHEGAAVGNGQAMTNLGTLHEYGPLEKDFPEAMKWYRKGVEAGHGEAMARLGLMYMRG